MNVPRCFRFLFLSLPATLLLLTLALAVHSHQCTFSFYDEQDGLHRTHVECFKPTQLAVETNEAPLIVATFFVLTTLTAVDPLPLRSQRRITLHSGRSPPYSFLRHV